MLTPDDSKSQWRRWARQRRANLPDVSARVCAHLQIFLKAQGAAVVLAYRALPGEVDVSVLAASFTLHTPRVQLDPAPHLTLHPWDSASEISRYGILEPPADAPQIARERVDTVLLPGLAFDLSGVRLGYGGGFYDRLLSGWQVRTVGVLPQALLVPALPRAPHDLPAQWLATETGVRRANQS